MVVVGDNDGDDDDEDDDDDDDDDESGNILIITKTMKLMTNPIPNSILIPTPPN